MMTRFIVNHSLLLSTLDKLILKRALQSYQVRHLLSRESSRLLRCVHPDDDSSIYQFDHSIGVLSNPRIVRHHDQGHAALAVQLAQQIEHGFFCLGI
jgi:alpha-ketoglutarate-dependent taurine dioxygenase